jgi:8-oxo-dGTP pyrophosphatase MutT (NUDIX family)
MARRERSAGVVLFRDDPKAEGGREFLLLDYGRYWDFPKGHLEPGEDDQTAALRELKEEAGITDARLLPGFAHEIVYYFRDRSKGLIRKEVVFFLASTRTRDVTVSHEHVGYAFLPLRQAMTRLTYPNAKAVLQAAADRLATLPASQADTMSA